MYSACRPGRTEKPVIQSISWFGPATKPSNDIRKCQSTFASAVCLSVSVIRRLLKRAERHRCRAELKRSRPNFVDVVVAVAPNERRPGRHRQADTARRGRERHPHLTTRARG